MFLSWFEKWRISRGQKPGRDAAKHFWRAQVLSRPREEWQTRQWSEAMRWYLNWLSHCIEKGESGITIAERVRNAVDQAGARRGHSPETRKSYRAWCYQYANWVGGDDPRQIMDERNASNFLSYGVTERKLAFTSQKQALNALNHFFRAVCGRTEVDFRVEFRRTEKRPPVVLDFEEITAILDNLSPTCRHAAELQYGSGVRLKELMKLRIKDVDIKRGQVAVRSGKGDKDRIPILPEVVGEKLVEWKKEIRKLHELDRHNGAPGVALPNALERKWPRAGENTRTTEIPVPEGPVESVAGLSFPESTDHRWQKLMGRNTEGELSRDDRIEREVLVGISEEMSLVRAQAFRFLWRNPGGWTRHLKVNSLLQMNKLTRCRIFLSSPADLAAARADLRRAIIEDLQNEPAFQNIHLDVVTWDDPKAPVPLDAHLTPQEAINRGLPRPSVCDVFMAFFWSRMGTPLKYKGRRFRSGTEFELYDALKAAPKTRSFVFKSLEPVPDVVPHGRAGTDDAADQQETLSQFFADFEGDGSQAGRSVMTFSDRADMVDSGVRLLRRVLDEKSSPSPPSWLKALLVVGSLGSLIAIGFFVQALIDLGGGEPPVPPGGPGTTHGPDPPRPALPDHTDLGTLGSFLEVTGSIRDGRVSNAYRFELKANGSFQVRNTGSDGDASVTVRFKTAGGRTMTSQLVYTPEHGINPKTFSLPAGTILMEVEYLGRPQSVYALRLSKVSD